MGYVFPIRKNAFAFGEIRAFTGSEVAAMQQAIQQTQAAIDSRSNDLMLAKLNPLNWGGAGADIVATNTGALATAQKALDNLVAVRDSVIESGDTDRYADWMNAVAVAGGFQAWDASLEMAGTSQVTAPIAQTAGDVAAGIGKVGSAVTSPVVWLGVGALALVLLFGRRG